MLRHFDREENNRNRMETRLYGGISQCRHSNKANKISSGNQTRQTPRHEQKRWRRLDRKCKDGNANACRKLCQKSNRKNSNSDLTRSLSKSRRSSKNNQDGKNKKLTRKELRKQRRRAKRQRRREQKRLRRKNKNKKLKKKKKQNSRKTRSTISPSTCRTKYIDTCSWPNCNRSCPKIKNPKTGKFQRYLSIDLVYFAHRI